MIEEHYFKAETINRPWGWIYIGAPMPQLEPEVLAAMEKIRKPFIPGIGQLINLEA